jgi:hypothetical protein
VESRTIACGENEDSLKRACFRAIDVRSPDNSAQCFKVIVVDFAIGGLIMAEENKKQYTHEIHREGSTHPQVKEKETETKIQASEPVGNRVNHDSHATSYHRGYTQGTANERNRNSQNYDRGDRQEDRENNLVSGLFLGFSVAALAALVGGTIYYLNARSQSPEPSVNSTPSTTTREEETTIIERFIPIPQDSSSEENSPQNSSPSPDPEINITVPGSDSNSSENQPASQNSSQNQSESQPTPAPNSNGDRNTTIDQDIIIPGSSDSDRNSAPSESSSPSDSAQPTPENTGESRRDGASNSSNSTLNEASNSQSTTTSPNASNSQGDRSPVPMEGSNSSSANSEGSSTGNESGNESKSDRSDSTDPRIPTMSSPPTQ